MYTHVTSIEQGEAGQQEGCIGQRAVILHCRDKRPAARRLAPKEATWTILVLKGAERTRKRVKQATLRFLLDWLDGTFYYFLL
jgi:hypothetical protein